MPPLQVRALCLPQVASAMYLFRGQALLGCVLSFELRLQLNELGGSSRLVTAARLGGSRQRCPWGCNSFILRQQVSHGPSRMSAQPHCPGERLRGSTARVRSQCGIERAVRAARRDRSG
jgi:hypothetical protein